MISGAERWSKCRDAVFQIGDQVSGKGDDKDFSCKNPNVVGVAEVADPKVVKKYFSLDGKCLLQIAKFYSQQSGWIENEEVQRALDAKCANCRFYQDRNS